SAPTSSPVGRCACSCALLRRRPRLTTACCSPLDAASWLAPRRFLPAVRCANFRIEISPSPLQMRILAGGGRLLQEIGAETSADGGYRFSFRPGAAPLYGLGQGGPQLDKRGAVDTMGSGQGGYRLATHGAKVPIPVLWSAEGWGLFVHQPLCSFDLTGETGWLVPHADRGGHEPGEALPGAGESIAGLP